MKSLKHHGVIGMHWGVRKQVDHNSSIKDADYKREGFVIKKGTTIHRLSTISNETNKGSAYASFLNKDAQSYRQTGKVFSSLGMKQFNMTMTANKDLVSPSQKERVDVFLKKLEDPVFAKELRQTQRRMYILNIPTPGDIQLAREQNISLGKSRSYRMLNQAISANKSLRKQYLDEFEKLHYDFILDEADSTTKVATAPIIIINRGSSVTVTGVEDL